MPYILPKDRKIKQTIDLTTGDLNFVITKICHEFIEVHGLSYQNINRVIGVLECAKLELYRQIAAPYEDLKKKENGHISELDK